MKELLLFALPMISAIPGCAMPYVYTVQGDPSTLVRALRAEQVQPHSIPAEIQVLDSNGGQAVLTSCRGYKFEFPIMKMLQQTANMLSSPEADNEHVTKLITVRFLAISCTAQGDLGEQWPLVSVEVRALVAISGRPVRSDAITSAYKAGDIYGNFNLTGYPDKKRAPDAYALATYRAIIDVLKQAVSAK